MNFLGYLGLAKDMISAAKENGADYAKFQTWRVKRLKPGKWDKDGRREQYIQSELTQERHRDLKMICNDTGIRFLTSCFCVDDLVRDLISLCADRHYVCTEISKTNVVSLTGSNSVFNFGCPSVEYLSSFDVGPCLDVSNMKHHFKDGLFVNPNEDFLLVCVHPNTTKPDDVDMDVILSACVSLGLKCIVIYPNVDAFNSSILDAIRRHKDNLFRIKHIEIEYFVHLMAHAKCMIGNSSAGIREAASFNIPVVNIGDRQNDRERNANILDCSCDYDAIVNAIKMAISTEVFHPNIYIYWGNFKCNKDRTFNRVIKFLIT